jgi:hypothetical protein
LSDDVANGLDESGVVENVGVAIGISLVAHSVLKIQSTSGLVSAMFVKGSQPCRGMSAVALSTWLWSKMWG